MSRFNDLADFILHNRSSGFSSESEMDDLPEAKITLPSDYQDKAGGSQVAIKLHELGPRMTLKLVKIEEGLCRGNVNFHAYIKKTKAEIKQQADGLKGKRELKAQRKKEQEENVAKKAELKAKREKEDEKEAAEADQEVEGADVDDDQDPTDGKKKLFANFQKNGKVVPNITSGKKRAPGISKGMWKKELKSQLGISLKKKRSGKRT